MCILVPVSSGAANAQEIAEEELYAGAISDEELYAGAISGEDLYAEEMSDEELYAGAISGEELYVEAMTGISGEELYAGKMAGEYITEMEQEECPPEELFDDCLPGEPEDELSVEDVIIYDAGFGFISEDPDGPEDILEKECLLENCEGDAATGEDAAAEEGAVIEEEEVLEEADVMAVVSVAGEFAAAADITVGKSYTVTSSQAAYYRFIVPSTGAYDLKCKAVSGVASPYIRIMDKYGVIFDQFDDDTSTRFAAVKGTEIYIAAGILYDNTPFTFSVNKNESVNFLEDLRDLRASHLSGAAIASLIAEASPISPGKAYTADTSKQQFFEFTVPETGVYRLKLCDERDFPPVFEIFTSNGELIADDNHIFEEGDWDDSIRYFRFYADKGEKLYLCVEPFNWYKDEYPEINPLDPKDPILFPFEITKLTTPGSDIDKYKIENAIDPSDYVNIWRTGPSDYNVQVGETVELKVAWAGPLKEEPEIDWYVDQVLVHKGSSFPFTPKEYDRLYEIQVDVMDMYSDHATKIGDRLPADAGMQEQYYVMTQPKSNHFTVTGSMDNSLTYPIVHEGTKFKVSVTAHADDMSKMKYTWYFCDDKGKEHPVKWGNTGEYTITAEKSGTYECFVDDGYGNCDNRDFPIEVTAHTPSGWQWAKKPSYTTVGKQIKKCTVCGKTMDSKTVPKLEKSGKSRKLTTKSGKSMKLNKKKLKLKKGKKYRLKVKSKPAGDKVTKWKSSRKKIAAITKKGVVKAKKKGKCTIRVYMKSGAVLKCRVMVK